ncbi:MAG: hypothetical protein ACI9I0_001001, partial [Rhodoferax sp.]
TATHSTITCLLHLSQMTVWVFKSKNIESTLVAARPQAVGGP